ncbi:hypothetical protein K4B79_18770 [Streptomyces lincolnensis]|uniref:hypothetical protein n=1 Tax=Streptomyces lincolnensis TaxID=1915 RepID=UPI001E62053F|nr:hypothetical protein [Streptomyces lincolnensis]MCD7440259.1 hypothetical protein [Streptomyces lincolnensis]
MHHGTDQPPEQPTPVAEDANVPAPLLHARAAVDYRNTQRRSNQLSREDRVHGMQTGGGY